MPRMKVELNWGPQYGGWIKGTVMEKADPGEELVQMHGQVRCDCHANINAFTAVAGNVGDLSTGQTNDAIVPHEPLYMTTLHRTRPTPDKDKRSTTAIMIANLPLRTDQSTPLPAQEIDVHARVGSRVGGRGRVRRRFTSVVGRA